MTSKLTKEGDTSSSDDDDEKLKLQSALDPSFVLISNEQSNNGGAISSCEKKKSIRETLERTEEFPKPYSLDVSLETQNFIAKKLSNALDKMINEVPCELKSVTTKNKKKEKGIYLFSSSSVRISSRELQEEMIPSRKQKKPELRRKRHVDDSDSGEEDEKLRAVAVSADWVKASSY